MKVVLFGIDMLMLVMFARFNRSCDEEFEQLCEEKKQNTPIRDYQMNPKYAHLKRTHSGRLNETEVQDMEPLVLERAVKQVFMALIHKKSI